MMARLQLFGFAVLLASSALGCGPYISRPSEIAPDCNAGAGYDLSRVFVDSSMLALGAAPSGFAFGDLTPGATLDQMQAVNTPAGQAIDVDPTLTCGHSRVFDMESAGHDDYGSSMILLLNGFNGAGTDGIFYWARAANVDTNSAVTLLLEDGNDNAAGGVCTPPASSTNPDSTTTNTVTTVTGTNATQAVNYEPAATDCGNDFQAVVEFTDVWTLYFVPWGKFAQLAQPNRDPYGVQPAQLYLFGIRVPKEAHFDLWIDQIGVYQPMSATAGQ
jgi:hypothetical protein